MRQLTVQFDKIIVNSIQINSGIFVGTNTQNAWSSHNKTNMNIGRISGDGNHFSDHLNVICDDDFIDTPIDGRGLVMQQM
jgi:hypothetical protein